jgi:hypothetical protein
LAFDYALTDLALALPLAVVVVVVVVAVVVVSSTACCPRPSEAPPEIWEAIRFDADSANTDSGVVFDNVVVEGLERWSSLMVVVSMVDNHCYYDVVAVVIFHFHESLEPP